MLPQGRHVASGGRRARRRGGRGHRFLPDAAGWVGGSRFAHSEGFGSQESNHLITGSRPPGRLQTEGLFQSHCRDKSHALGVSVFAVKATMEGRTVRRPRSR